MKQDDQLTSGCVSGEVEPRLDHRVVKGGFWVFALHISQQILAAGRLLILVQLLAPGDFGLLGIALLIMAVLENFTQTGFSAALVQKKGNIKSYLNTAWTIGLIRAVILFGILYFIAPCVVRFFDQPDKPIDISQAVDIIRIMGISFLIGAFSNATIVYFSKELEFHKQFVMQMSGTVVDILVAVPIALICKSVWALVLGSLAGNFVRIILSYIIHPYRPRLELDKEKVKELWGFGKWVFGSSLLGFLINQGDDIVVGKVLGVVMLGYYQMAFKISNMPTTEITAVISGITFPAYSKLQDDLPRLRRGYLKVIQLAAFLSFPIAGLIFVLADDFTRIFMGQKWMPMVATLQVLTVWGLIRSLATVVSSPFGAMGRPKIITKIHFLKFVLLAILIYPLTVRWGILGAAFAVVLNPLVVFPLMVYIALKLIRVRFVDMARLMVLPMLGMLIMANVVVLFKGFIFAHSDTVYLSWLNIIYFLLSVIIGILTYTGVMFLCDLKFDYGIRKILKEQLVAIKS
jgi:O-antigen/teichoic acid export membrane protein